MKLTREMLFDKREDREYSNEEELERYRRRIMYGKGLKKKANKGKVLINDGKVQKMVLADLPIPEGWERGAIRRHEQ